MNDQNPNEPFDELMRKALRDEADRIEPADALPEIRARAHSQRRPVARRPWLLTAGVAALGTAAAVGAFTVFNGGQNTANDGDAVAGPGTTATASGVPQSRTPSVTKASPSPVPATLPPTTSPAVKTAQPTDRGKPEQSVSSAVVPVYWLGQQAGVPKKSAARLYRTWSKVSGRPAEEAVRIMTTKQPQDPDYYSVWRGAAVNSVTRSDGVVTVDFKQLPKTTLDADLASVATQQLIYTVQGALADDSSAVQITQQGRAGQKLFGQVDTSAPLGRAQAADVQALVWITSPGEGSVTSGKVTVQGTANAFEATVNYQLTNLKTRETKTSFTSTKEGQKFSPFSFSVSLSPGPWQIEAYLISDADGSITNTDSKTILVK
ncbi:Gmad2 immunoglobulin-like domain-containing protein [Kribbella sp. NPDC051586]|uniref:Gmad2 immunoglobulin-like domain-containing protein n=1 Tax=Kribbella sp. NPDC051586 TaxID=3364118 RepID=UPI0037950FB9